MFKIPLLFVATLLAASLVTAETAYFALQENTAHDEFIIQVKGKIEIATATVLLNRGGNAVYYPTGRIVKSKAPYNPLWDFHMDPDSIEFIVAGTKPCESSLDVLADVTSPSSYKAIPDNAEICPDAPIVREVRFGENYEDLHL